MHILRHVIALLADGNASLLDGMSKLIMLCTLSGLNKN
jgi:hypothetical protein